jgi:TATA-box binding protein (TBP) (component of TFIID and TFIIIB)
MLMQNGKLLFCGGSSPDAVVLMAWMLLHKLYEKGLITEPGVTLMNLNVENIVCSYSLGYDLNIELFHADHGDTSVYQPEKISPVQWYPNSIGLAIVMYSTGELIITGNRTLPDAITATTLRDWTRYGKGREYRPFVCSNVSKKSKKPPRKVAVMDWQKMSLN